MHDGNGIDDMTLKATQPSAISPPAELNEEDRSKDEFFSKTGALAEAMIAAHGKDFAIGTLVLAAKFIAEGKPLSTPLPIK
jgi:hypothetical protein